MHRFLPVMVLLFYLSTSAQVDQKKLDSLSKSIDSSEKIFRSWQDSFAKVQDSIYQTAIGKTHSRNTDQFLAGQRKSDDTEQQKFILRLVIGVVLLAIGVLAWSLKRKTKS